MTKTIYVKVRLTLEGEHIITHDDIVDVINDLHYDFYYDNGLIRLVESDDLEIVD